MNGLQLGDVVDRYVLDVLLGEGGMASVYRVQHAELGTLHALKVLHLSSPSVRERMLQEGRIQAGLRHPNIVAVTDVIRVAGAPGLVLEYVDGPSLDELLRTFQPSLPQVDSLARGIIAGVAAAHAKGLIHRDLKPGNVLIAVEGGRVVAKVADFGLAKVMDNPGGGGPRTASGLAMGTPSFMAPEQLRDAKNVDHRADVFSLGCVLYELVTGVPAFSSNSLIEAYEATSSERFRPPRELAPSVPRRMEAAIVGALRADLSERIASCEALLALWTGDVSDASVGAQAWEPEHVALVQKLGPSSKKPLLSANPTFTASALPAPAPTLTAPASEPEPPARSRWLWAVALAALMLTGCLVAGTAGVVWWLQRAELQVEPAPTAVSAPAQVPEVAPAPVEAAPEAALPVAAAPAPRPPVAPASAPVAPAPAQPARATGPSWQVQGAPRAVLVGADGERFDPGAVPAGTYTLAVYFDPAKPTDMMTLTLAGTEQRVVRCNAALRSCK